MTTDLLLTVLNVVFGLVLTGIGIEMVNNPPGEIRWKRWAYRILFIVFGIAVVVTTAMQSVRNQSEQERLRKEAAATEIQLSNQVSAQGGKLDAIAHFEQQFLTFVQQRPTSDAAAKAYETMASAVVKLASGANPATAAPPPGGRLEILYDGSTVDGKTILAGTANGQLQLSPFHTKNVGKQATGSVSVRLYFNKPVNMTVGNGWFPTESEEPGYPICFYASGMPAIIVNPSETWNWQPFFAMVQNWKQGDTVSAKIKFFYGTEKPSAATFTIRWP